MKNEARFEKVLDKMEKKILYHLLNFTGVAAISVGILVIWDHIGTIPTYGYIIFGGIIIICALIVIANGYKYNTFAQCRYILEDEILKSFPIGEKQKISINLNFFEEMGLSDKISMEMRKEKSAIVTVNQGELPEIVTICVEIEGHEAFNHAVKCDDLKGLQEIKKTLFENKERE